MVVSIEQHVDWIARCIHDLDGEGYAAIEASPEAQTHWVAHVNEVASRTLYNKARSWYVGANVPGKPQVFMPYVGGVSRYTQICDEVATDGYKGYARVHRGERVHEASAGMSDERLERVRDSLTPADIDALRA
jgi:cyclohexanone monooxygenase